MNSAMENMVNNLTRNEQPSQVCIPTATPGIFNGSPTPTLKTPVAQSFAERGVASSQSATITPRDHLPQFPGVKDHINSRPPLPSIWNTPFAPRPGETPGSSPRLSTAQGLQEQTAGSQNFNSPGQFQADIMQMQQQIQMRSSPLESFQPTMSSHYDTPSHLTSWVRAADQLQPQLSPWQSSFSPVPTHVTVIPNRSPEPAPFGAIGEPRPKSSRTPKSGQGG